MMIYEVNIIVEASQYDELCVWLSEHVEEVLSYSQFLDAEAYEIEINDEKKGVSIHYFVPKPAFLEKYLIEHAPRLKIKAQSEFSFPLHVTQRVLTSIEL